MRGDHVCDHAGLHMISHSYDRRDTGGWTGNLHKGKKRCLMVLRTRSSSNRFSILSLDLSIFSPPSTDFRIAVKRDSFSAHCAV